MARHIHRPARIDFVSHADEEIKRLADACDPATFGRGEQDVLDESYRRAGKLDKGDFALTFDPEQSGLLHLIRHMVLEGHNSDKTLKVELYKLNVYGPESFFKAHKDTPRAENMLASLVVVFPTRHQGGALLFRHDGREFRFDSAKAIADASTPSVAYAPFYGDVEHEVEPVVSGYRVTVTYNLYLIDSPTKSVPEKTPYELALRDAFDALLRDKAYLPAGGLVGFGLRHEYPVDPVRFEDESREFETWPPKVAPLDGLVGALKGSDAILMKVCKDLGLTVSLQMLYHGQNNELLLCPGIAPVGSGPHESYITYYFVQYAEAKFIRQAYGEAPDIEVHWATQIRPANVKKTATPFVAYGNDAFMAKIYSTICLIVEIQSAEVRSTDGQNVE